MGDGLNAVSSVAMIVVACLSPVTVSKKMTDAPVAVDTACTAASTVEL